MRKDNVDTPSKSARSIEGKFVDFFSNWSVSTLIRFIGAALLVVSASTFMIQKVSDQNDTVRYFALLGHTVLLGAAGIFCALRLGESRSARTFFSIVLASVPVHFAALGGLLYSQFRWDAALQQSQPNTWMASSPFWAIVIPLIGIGVLVPLTLFSMMSLARKKARSLTAGFIAMNLLLLVPVRFPDAAPWVVALGGVLFYWMEQRYFSKVSTLKTMEGRILRFILLTPALVVLGRVLHFYSASTWFYSCAFTLGALFLFVLSPKLKTVGKGVQWVLAPMVGLGAMICFEHSFHGLWADGPHRVYLWSVYWLAVSATVALLGIFYAGDSRVFYRIGLLMWVTMSVISMLLMPLLFTTIIAVGAAAVALFVAVQFQQKITAAVSIGALMTCAVFHLHDVIRFSSVSHWGVLLAAGVTLVVGASVFDKQKAVMYHRVQTIKMALHSWSY